jgi:hypothetical protein
MKVFDRVHVPEEENVMDIETPDELLKLSVFEHVTVTLNCPVSLKSVLLEKDLVGHGSWYLVQLSQFRINGGSHSAAPYDGPTLIASLIDSCEKQLRVISSTVTPEAAEIAFLFNVLLVWKQQKSSFILEPPLSNWIKAISVKPSASPKEHKSAVI